MIKQLFQTITNKDKNDAVQNLISHSVPSKDFFLMIILAILMATFGLLIDSMAVVVGSMLIAPVLYPILSLSMGIVMSDFKLVSKSFSTLLKVIVFSIIASALVTLLFVPDKVPYTSEIIARTYPSLIVAAIGIVAGFAASFALVKPKLNETLPGIAVSVALVPPLAVIGIGLARFDIQMVFKSLLYFGINAVGIIFTSMIVFSFMNFYAKRELAEQTVKKEEKILEKENKINPNQ